MADEEQTIDLAYEHHKAGRLPEAESLYRKILANNPDHHIALHYLGLLGYQLGHDDTSVELIKRAVFVKPDYLQAHCNLANTLVELGRANEAETSCRNALALDPDKAGAHATLGKVFAMLGRYDEAIASCEKALALEPNLDTAFETIGNALSELGRADEAVESYQKAISLNPDEAGYYNNLGNAFGALGQWDDAIKAYQKAISIDQEDGLYYNNLGSALHMTRQLDLAVDSYRQAISHSPKNTMAYQNLANVFRDMGRLDDAVTCFQEILKFEPDHRSARHNLHAMLGNTTEGAPQEYVEDLFNQFANQFEGHLIETLEYKIPTLLRKVLGDTRLTKEKFDKVVDLGCGTGLAGVEFRDIANTLIGIDLSKGMIQEAKNKGVYDQLYVDDLVQGLGKLGEGIDLFISTDVFIYVGNLEATFEAVRKSAAPNAYFVFSTEHSETPDEFVLQSSSRYAHSKAYIEHLANQFGFKLEHFEETKLRKENSGWIAGAVYVLKC